MSASHEQSKLNSSVKETDSNVQQSTECVKKGSNACSNKHQSNLECEVRQRLQVDLDNAISSSSSSEILATETCSEGKSEQLDNINEDVPNESNSSTDPNLKCERTDASQLQSAKEEEISSNPSENKSSVDSIEKYVYSEINVDENVEGSDNNKDNVIKASSTSNKNKKNEKVLNKDAITNKKNTQMIRRNMVSNVLIISDAVQKESESVKEVTPVSIVPPEKKVKKVERPKSKPAPPPSPPVKKINRDECDWDSLFDDNGDCLDPTLIEEVSIYIFLSYNLKSNVFTLI